MSREWAEREIRGEHLDCEAVRQLCGAESHCSSCHYDTDEGYGSLSEVEIGGEFIAVCCAVALRYETYQDAITRSTPCYCDNIGRALCPKHRVA